MVFPVETRERMKHRALSVYQEHLRKIMEISRKVSQVVDFFLKEDKESIKLLLAEIKALEDGVDISRRLVSQELAQIGAVLISREDFFRLTMLTNEISDFCEGIAFRLLQILERKWKVPSDIKEGLAALSDAVFVTISKFRETAMTLNYSPEKVREKARTVEVAERNVDDLYRELSMKILNSRMSLPVLLLLRDITQLLEDAADKAEDASDVTRILAFTI